jgi:8-oxo-dGTP pyrophosphatase MutT (NUDIX family)
MNDAPTIRHAARVVLIDHLDRVLLLRGTDPSVPDSGFWWFTPGGGLEADESPIDAARRELQEEIGIDLEIAGPSILTRVARFVFNGVDYEQHESYFAARVHEHTPDFSGLEPYELDAIVGWQWFTIDELHAAGDPVHPEQLVATIATLLDGHP